MRYNRALTFVGLLLAVTFFGSLLFGHGAEALTLRRGVAIHNMMNWARINPPPSTKYAWPPFNGHQFELPDSEILVIRQAGFDFVRLTVDPGPFLQFEGYQRDDLDRILVNNIRRLQRFGFKVVVDFHPNSQNPEFAPKMLARGVDDALFVRYVKMIHRTAAVLAQEFPNDMDTIALEPMNEPYLGYLFGSSSQWQQMIERLHAAARSASERLSLVVTGDRYGNYLGLIQLNPNSFRDENTFYTFHYYLPFEFTNQGNAAEESAKYYYGNPYPTKKRTFKDAWPDVERRIQADNSNMRERSAVTAAARRQLSKYFEKSFDARTIAENFDKVLGWAMRYNINPSRILLGEFGVMRTYGSYVGAPNDDRHRWLEDVRRAAEVRGFPWAIWVYKGYGGMAIVADDKSINIDPIVLDALGLNKNHPSQ